MARHASCWIALVLSLASCQVDADGGAGRPSHQLKLIGAGLPRTGMQSLYEALTLLGFLPSAGITYQLDVSVFRPWRSFLFDGGSFEPALATVRYAGWNATLDFPFFAAYSKLMEVYPEAKVLLTVRSTPRAWTKSYIRHIPEESRLRRWGIIAFLRLCGFSPEEADPELRMNDVKPFHDCDVIAFHRARPEEREALMQRCDQGYQRWVDEVIRTVPADRLLVYNTREGWGPLCKFLHLPEPSLPFPRIDEAHDNYITQVYSGLAMVGTSCLGLLFLYLRCRRLWNTPWIMPKHVRDALFNRAAAPTEKKKD